MKKLLLILIALPMIGFGQQTYVPDANFEQALINLGYDTGTPNGSVPTANINTVTSLWVDNENISDLTGIEDFTSLEMLGCSNNQLTSLVIPNTLLMEVWCRNNLLTTIDISGATALIGLSCDSNQLTSIDVSNNVTNFTVLDCRYNQLTTLDVSQNDYLEMLECGNNPNLTSLDLRNNSWQMQLWTQQTPNLYCINVNNPTSATNGWTFANGNIDPQHYFSINCPPPSWDCNNNGVCNDPGTGSGQYSTQAACAAVCGVSAIQEHTTNKELLKVTDLLGRETKGTKNEVLFYIYDDGTVEKRITID